MSPPPIVFSFADSNQADRDRFAGSLAETLRGFDLQVERVRERPDTQDFGATLVVILGTTAVTKLASGIATWMARHSGAKIEIRLAGEVVLTASDLDSKDVPKLAEVLRKAGFGNG